MNFKQHLSLRGRAAAAAISMCGADVTRLPRTFGARNDRFRWLIGGLVAICMAPVALAETTTKTFTGYGYELDSGAFRYTEHHSQTLEDGQIVDWQVEYRNPQGQMIASKWLKPGDNPAVPEYELSVKTNGYVEGIRRIDANTIELKRQKPGEDTPETKTVSHDASACADSGFDAYLRQNWDRAIAGKKLKFDFIAAGRLADYGFKAKRIDDTTFEGKPAVRFEVSLASFLGVFIDSLVLSYDPDSKKLLEYRGVGNLPGDDDKVYPVRVSYYSQRPDDLPPAPE